jgi:transposase-like protein
MRKHDRRDDPQRQQQWQAAVGQWQRSGRSVREYCRSEGLKESAFYFWRRKLAQESLKGDGPSPVGETRRGQPTSLPRRPVPRARRDQARFLPVQLVTGREQRMAGGVEIIAGDGHVVRVLAGFDRQTLAEVLAVLEVRPC